MTESALTATRSRTNPGADAQSYPSWRALAWFSPTRLCIAAGLLAVLVSDPAKLWRTAGPLPLTAAVAMLYAILVLLGALAWFAKWDA